MKIYSPECVRKAEKYMIEARGVSSLGLMKKAAGEMYRLSSDFINDAGSICVLCGKGNNAGDGYELARLIHNSGKNVICVRVFSDSPDTDIAQICYNDYVNAGGLFTDNSEKALKELVRADVVIDAVFGIGFKGCIEEKSSLYRIIDIANRSSAKRIALDVPSGVNCADGSIGNIAFDAELTLTVNVVKAGMLSYPAKKYCGQIKTLDIGIPEAVINSFEEDSFITPDDGYISSVLPGRKEDSNKGDFGKLLCVCGCEQMTGAAVMAVGAALRSGAGLVTLASEKAVSDVVKVKYPEPIYRNLDFSDDRTVRALTDELGSYSAVLIGCGLGKGEKKKHFIESAIKNYTGVLVIDADGINLISDNINILKEAAGTVILTPHPGEFSRIIGQKTEYINSNRIKCAKEFSSLYRCITVLKGAGTVVACHGEPTGINTTGNPGLAKGGSGDVLAGLIAGLAANKHINPFDAALSGVYLHGKAADVLKTKYSEYGLLPSDLAKEFAKMLP